MGTYGEPFSAHRYRDIQRELSHVTLAQRGDEFSELAHKGDEAFVAQVERRGVQNAHDASGERQNACRVNVVAEKLRHELVHTLRRDARRRWAPLPRL